MGSIAKISGVALRPGVSRNMRLYTAGQIEKAAARMQERLADPDGLPIPMRTHHDAGDETDRIVGRITEVSVDNDKALRYKAELYDTKHGKDIAALATSKHPALRSVSIHGYWLGDTKQVSVEGVMATTADDLEIDAIDFTAFPGVVGALIDASSSAAESVAGRTPISEAMEAQVLLEEGSGWAAVPESVSEGDQGAVKDDGAEEAKYSADDMKAMLSKGHAIKNPSGEPSYPIKDKADLAKAIKAVGRGNADHDTIRRHIIKRAKALGAADMVPGNWNSDGSMKESVGVRFSEVREYYPDGPGSTAGFCVDAYSGPLSVTVRGCVSPDQLRGAAQAAVMAAMAAIGVMDPDEDADIDAGDEGMSGSETVSVEVAGQVLTEESVRAMLLEELSKLREQFKDVTLNSVRAEVAAESGVEEMTLPPEDHSHTHEMDGEAHTHAHQHDHTAESDGGTPYTHGHTHGHVHASSDGPSHDHGHGHIHTTSSSATAESNQEEESAMSDTNQAAEAAPTRALTDEDMKVLGETIGGALAEALRAVAEMNAPKHAATQETTESVTEEVPAEIVPPKADIDVVALKESLAKELRKELRDELRSEFLEEKGLPQRRGYRVSETSDEERELTDKELFDQHRVDILLGQYAATPKPGDVPSA